MSIFTNLFNNMLKNANDEDRVLTKRKYHLVRGHEPLGEGSYATVRLAYSAKLGREVAIKIIDRRKAPTDFLQRFLPRELEILPKLQHPHIVQIYDIFEAGDKVYFVMELASGGDLLEFIKKHDCVKENLAREIFSQIVAAVAYCHDNGVIHRDLKCENVLLDSKHNVRLTDFGFAKFNPQKEMCKTFCGSAAYAAYEILKGVPYDGQRSDVWSLGVILYTMVTGHMPFDDSNMKNLLKQIKRGVDFHRPKQLVSDDCKDLIRSMLTTDAAARIALPNINSHRWFKREIPTVNENDDEQSSKSGKQCKQKQPS